MSIHIIISVLILVVALVLGMPIPFAFGGSFLYLTYTMEFNPSTLLASGYTQINSTILLAIPLFVLAGKIMEKGHIGDALIGLVQRFVGKIKSGLGAVAVVTCAVFGSISGSASATLSCIGALMEPRMTKSGYPKGYTAALLAAACPLGLLIPPLFGPDFVCLVQRYFGVGLLYSYHYSGYYSGDFPVHRQCHHVPETGHYPARAGTRVDLGEEHR